MCEVFVVGGVFVEFVDELYDCFWGVELLDVVVDCDVFGIYVVVFVVSG